MCEELIFEKLSKKCESRFTKCIGKYYNFINDDSQMALAYINDAYYEMDYYRNISIDFYGHVGLENDLYKIMIEELKTALKVGGLKITYIHGVSNITNK